MNKEQTHMKSKVAILEEWRSSDSPYVHEDDIYGAMEDYANQFKTIPTPTDRIEVKEYQITVKDGSGNPADERGDILGYYDDKYLENFVTLILDAPDIPDTKGRETVKAYIQWQTRVTKDFADNPSDMIWGDTCEPTVQTPGIEYRRIWKLCQYASLSNSLSQKEGEMREVLAKWENEAKSYKQYDDRIELGIITGCIQDLKEALKDKQ